MLTIISASGLIGGAIYPIMPATSTERTLRSLAVAVARLLRYPLLR